MLSGLSRAKPDGLNIGIAVNMPIVMQLIVRPAKIPFRIKDFDYLGTVVWAQLAIVALKDAPYSDMKGLIAYAKKSGKPLTVAHDTKPQAMIMNAIARSAGRRWMSAPRTRQIEQSQTRTWSMSAVTSKRTFPQWQAPQKRIYRSVPNVADILPDTRNLPE